MHIITELAKLVMTVVTIAFLLYAETIAQTLHLFMQFLASQG